MSPKRPSKAKAFSYTRKEEQAIWRALRSAGVQKGITKEDVIVQLTKAAHSSLLKDQNHRTKSKPYASQIRQELRKFSQASHSLTEAIQGLSPDSRSLLTDGLQHLYLPKGKTTLPKNFVRKSLQLLYSPPHSSQEFLGLVALMATADNQAARLQHKPTREQIQLDVEKEVLANLPPEVRKIIEQSHKAKSNVSLGLPNRGAPIDMRQESFGYSLCAIFFEATGRLPKMNYDSYKEEPSGPFFHFSTAAIHPTGLLQDRKSPVALLKKVSKDYSPPTRTRRKPTS